MSIPNMDTITSRRHINRIAISIDRVIGIQRAAEIYFSKYFMALHLNNNNRIGNNLVLSENNGTSVMNITLADRLAAISDLPEGWYEPGCPAPTSKAIKAMHAFIQATGGGNGPHLYPMIDGGVSAEWTHDNWHGSIEVSPCGQRLEFNAFNIATGAEFTDNVLSTADDIADRFNSFWKSMQ